MSNEMNVTVGSKAIVKVGCREIKAEVLEVTENGCQVKSLASGKEFSTARILRVITPEETPVLEDTSIEIEQPTESEEQDAQIGRAHV